MKKKSLFNLLIIMVIVAFVGLGLTITLAVIMGGNATNIYNIVYFFNNIMCDD